MISYSICGRFILKKGGKMIDEELLKILACPACKADIFLKEEKIVCSKCGRKYPIKDGIPIMLIEEAQIDEKNEKK